MVGSPLGTFGGKQDSTMAGTFIEIRRKGRYRLQSRHGVLPSGMVSEGNLEKRKCDFFFAYIFNHLW